MSKLSSNNIYLTVGQAFVFNPGWYWANYNISVQVWILLSVASDGTVSGSVQKTSWWADEGAFYDYIEALMEADLQLAAISINSALATGLSGLKVHDLYYLPHGVEVLGRARKSLSGSRLGTTSTLFSNSLRSAANYPAQLWPARLIMTQYPLPFPDVRRQTKGETS